MLTRTLLTLVLATTTYASTTPQVEILSPVDGSIVTGATMLRAKVEPSSLASSVMFFADGIQVCTTTKPPFDCEWDAGPSIAAHHVRLVVTLSAGGRIVRNARTTEIAFAETVDVDAVQVTVSVTDDRGRYVKGLPQSAFQIKEDGQPQKISQFYAEGAPLELVVAVDTSGSIRPAIQTLRRSVSTFLAAVPPRDRVTLLGFNEDVFVIGRRTADLTERLQAVERLTAWGSTVLYDAILLGAETLESQPGRKALVVFTDGEDQGSNATFAEVERLLQGSDLALYMIGQGQAVTSRPLTTLMERLSRPTGGRAFSTDSINALDAAFRELLDELSNQYVLAYQPTNTARDDTWREISVSVDGHRQVRARQGYRAPGSRASEPGRSTEKR
jgi:Ca-activated chloride channel family protein